MMINELDMVVLKHDLAEHGLERGDIGAVVHCYGDGEALEVEFTTGEGGTLAVLTLKLSDVRLMKTHEILHARHIAA